MATFDTTNTSFGSAPAASRFFAAFGAIVASVASWNEARATRNALAGLTDRELEDIGLSRADIEAVATNKRLR